MGKFKKGMFLGGLLGAGLMWLNTTAKGKEFRSQILDHSTVVYKDMKDKLSDPELRAKLTKNKYAEMVKEAVDKYASHNKLGSNVKKTVEKLVKGQWKNFKK